MNIAYTANNALALEHSLDNYLEFFSKGGSIQEKDHYYFYHEQRPIDLFKTAWCSGNNKLSMQLLFWCRDCRGGAGSRETFRKCIKWIAQTEPNWIRINIEAIPLYGRWDDLKALYDTACELDALECWTNGIINNETCHYAAKWAGRKDNKLRKHMKLSPKAYRQLLVERTGWVVEKDMCSNNWNNIDYSKVPSVAGARLCSAFNRHDAVRYSEWCKGLADDNTVNAKVLFPHDVVRLVKSQFDETDEFYSLTDAMFNALPNYIEDPNIKIMPVCDFSASMTVQVTGKITAMDVCLGLGLYCSDKLGKTNPFYRKLIPFSSTSKLESWQVYPVADAIRLIPNGYVGSTNIEHALNNLLDSAVMWNVKKEDMITHLLILSDMQFNAGTENSSQTVIENCMDKWVQAGYTKPKIVYWNLHMYDNQPATKHENNVAMVSGFSPSVLKCVLKDKDFNPIKIMLETVSKYKVNVVY